MAWQRPTALQTAIFTALAMVAFAANSVLCRLALGPPDIDATSFTTIRLFSGAAVLLAISRLSGRRRTPRSRGSWLAGVALFLYAIMFSYAYLRLHVGTGALILFALVQVTMIAWGITHGERLRPHQWLGLVAALGGLVYLVAPGLAAPPLAGSLMMGTAGIA
jgi:drug/metabolite transporter (DMT)-like permease